MPNLETYKEDPAKYVDECFKEFEEYHTDHIAEADKEAKGLFCNYSEKLEKRKKDPWVDMSTLFSPLVQPHVLSRVAQFIGTILSNDPIVKWQPLPGTSVENAKTVQDLVLSLFLGDHLENTTRLTELLTAAELRKEAVVKITPKQEEHQELTLENDGLDLGMRPEELADMGISLPAPPEPLPLSPKRTLKTVKGNTVPSWDLLPEKAFIRDPYPWRKENWLYCGDHKWVSEAYLRDLERSGDYENIDKVIEEAAAGEGGGAYPDDTTFNIQSASNTLAAEPDNFSYDEMLRRTGQGGDTKRYEHSHHLIELWVIVPKKGMRQIELPPPHPPRAEVSEWTGETEVRIITTVNGIEVANRVKKEPYLQIDWPYVQFKAITVPNQMEGLSTAEVEAPLQHMENELYNQRIDAGRYLLFPPLQIDSRCRVLNDAVWGINRIWKVESLKEYGGVQPIIMSPQAAQMIAAFQGEQMLNRTNAENLVGATDLIQGSRNVKTDRTLGETKIRHEGTISRLNLTLVNYATGIIGICDMFEKMLQELIPLDQKGMRYFGGRYDQTGLPQEETVTFDKIKGRFKKTMAHVAEHVDAINERLLWTMLFERLNPDPIFGTPERHYKLVRRYMEAHRVKEIDDLMGEAPMLGQDQLASLLMALFSGGAGGNRPSLRPTVTQTAQPGLGITSS